MNFSHHATCRAASAGFDGAQVVGDQRAKSRQCRPLVVGQRIVGLLAHDDELLAVAVLDFEHVACELVDLGFSQEDQRQAVAFQSLSQPVSYTHLTLPTT